MKLKTLKDLYVMELKDLYNAEKQIVKALPKMAKAATSPELKAGVPGTPGADQGAGRAAEHDLRGAGREADRARPARRWKG